MKLLPPNCNFRLSLKFQNIDSTFTLFAVIDFAEKRDEKILFASFFSILCRNENKRKENS